ncbi:hypothetical protein BV20DRAFT_784561 [Pilatotrama ljubarskyi]|nr:hypothetical protein BV20DRAFT_784561 [Pilatotrama ljubarskyi]
MPDSADDIPMEICEAIIDCVWPDQDTLQRCALICHAWLPRSRYNLYRRVSIRRPEQLSRLSRRLLASLGEADLVQELLLAPLDSFAPMRVVEAGLTALGRRLPRLEKLFINLLIHPGDVPQRNKLDLSLRLSSHIANFPSLNHVALLNVTLPSFLALARMAVALPHLTSLRLHNVSWPTVGKIPPDFLTMEGSWLNLERITVTGGWDELPGISLLFGAASPNALKSVVIDSYASMTSDFPQALHFLAYCPSFNKLVVYNHFPAHAGNFEAFARTVTGMLKIASSRGWPPFVLDFAHVGYTSRRDLVLIAGNIALVMQDVLLELQHPALPSLEIRIWDNSDRVTWWQTEIRPHFQPIMVGGSLILTVSDGWDVDPIVYEDGAV